MGTNGIRGQEAQVEGLTDRPYASYAELAGQHVFISGGGSGIGAHLVDAFAAQGAQVSFVSLPSDPGHALCDVVAQRRGMRPQFQPCDLRDLGALESTMAQLAERMGPITVLINNAARDDRHTLEGLDPAGWDDLINTNLRPYFFTAKAVAAPMRTARRGSIINMGSNSANLGLGGYPAYVTAKAGIVGLTKALARELGPDGIRVNALIPGWVMTARQLALWATPAARAECLAQQGLKRMVEGSDIAAAALFLASEAAAMITGQSLIVDGGRAMP
jgi:galactose dehydrogenase